MSDNFDRLLARAERRDRDVPGTCPDPAVLAAYLDGTLASAERTMIEAHAADCSRCALQLATIVRLEDESGVPRSAPEAPLWRRLLWTVPVATAALAAIIYVALPSRSPLSTPQRETFGAPAATIPRAESARPASPPDGSVRDEASIPAETLTRPTAAQKQRTARLEGRQAARSLPSQDAGAIAENQAAAVTESAAPAATPQVPPPAAEVVGRADSAVPEERKLESDARAKAADTLATAAPAPAGGLAVREGSTVRALGERVSTAAVLIVQAPNARVRWRVIASRIERSTDGGLTWSTEPSPAAAFLTMGAAASADVCWLASPAGQVLRRAETGAWADVSPVPRVAITRLEAPDPLSAAIVTADGTRLRTSDAGRTWVREDR